MAKIHSLGFPRIGANRELKFTLEKYWRGEISESELESSASILRKTHWQAQHQCDFIPVNDFSFYDHILDTSFLLGVVPQRVEQLKGSYLDKYFRVARGRSPVDIEEGCVHAGEMTKWFDTNYHFIVPELSADTTITLNPQRFLQQIEEAKQAGIQAKPVLPGPVTWLYLSKTKANFDKLTLLPTLISAYKQLLSLLAEQGVHWIQLDEPILVTDLDARWQQAITDTYHALHNDHVNVLLATYFGELQDNLELLAGLPVSGVHIDAVTAPDELIRISKLLSHEQVLSAGVISGRNIWKSDLSSIIEQLTPIHEKFGDHLWVAPSCSLLHVPVDLSAEDKLDSDIKNWLAFAVQKLDELSIIRQALNEGPEPVAAQLAVNQQAIEQRRSSTRVTVAAVQQRLTDQASQTTDRQSTYDVRSALQQDEFKLPLFPTTTIGSFPQTKEIRRIRRQFRLGELAQSDYETAMKDEIAACIKQQEALDLDVLVHGEAERNDMVEYFGEHLEGYVFTRFGWVQSYGSRCVKPPIIFGDISRPSAITVSWAEYAQSLTHKPVKGMLTGPVTILNWSFVRDDQPRSETCKQLALAMRDEVKDLEAAGISMIQIDEAALREGLPLRRSQWQEYLTWAVDSFKLCASDVADETQIHTHMCYSEFNDIIHSIARMDADVITIETSRSDMELLDVFDEFNYPNDIGPGVYDIHSPNTPTENQITGLMEKAAQRIPVKQLWINPDCGLKTRQWDEVLPALKNMVSAAKVLRTRFS